MSAFLDAHVVVHRPTHTLDVRLTAERGDVVAVIGPNGAGKSTLVRALAGIVPLDAGRVVCDGETWDGGPRGAQRLETRRRDVGMAFQKDLLFPHLTALGNVAFGPRSRGVARREAETAALAWLTRLGVEQGDRVRHALRALGQAAVRRQRART